MTDKSMFLWEVALESPIRTHLGAWGSIRGAAAKHHGSFREVKLCCNWHRYAQMIDDDWNLKDNLCRILYLVGGLEHEFYDFPIILGMSSSQLTFIFFRGVGRYTTNQLFSAFFRVVAKNHQPARLVSQGRTIRTAPGRRALTEIQKSRGFIRPDETSPDLVPTMGSL
jgi:hypothetical protein